MNQTKQLQLETMFFDAVSDALKLIVLVTIITNIR